MVPSVLYLANAGNLAALDGATLTLAVFTDAYVPSVADPDLDTIDADEVDTADAPGYAQATFTARWDGPTSTLHVDEDGALAGTFDLDGATVAHYVVAKADGSLVASFSFAPTPGYDSWPVTFPNGIATPIDLADLLSRLAQVEDDVAAAIVVSGTPTDGQVPTWNATDEVYEPGDVTAGTSAAVATVGLVIAADAVDGTGDEFELLVSDPDAAGSGVVPAGWDAPGATADAAALASYITGVFGSGGTNVAVPELGKVFEVVPADISNPWPEVDATVGDATGYTLWPGLLLMDGTSTVAIDADRLPFDGFGLLDDGPTTVKAAIDILEGIADRVRFVSAVATSNVNRSALGSASFEYGDLRFVDGEANPVDETNMWLLGQTDPSQNGHYKVADDYTWTKVAHPDTFAPPGQGALLVLSNPDSVNHGTMWRWLDHDPRQNMRANSDATTAVGDWLLVHDPTASGGAATDADDLASLTHAATSKATPVDADELFLVDSAASNGPKKLTWANVKATIAKLLPRTHVFASGIRTGTHARTTDGSTTGNRLWYLPFNVAESTSIDELSVYHAATTSSTGGYRLGIYSADPTTGLPATLVVDAGVADTTTAAAAFKTASTGLPITLAPGLHYAAAVLQVTGGTPTVSTGNSPVMVPMPNQASGGFRYQDSVSGALPSTPTLATNGATSGPVVFLEPT